MIVCSKLGLQWTREIFSSRGVMGLTDMVQRYPMNVVIKVERFPKELYDEAKYGPLDQWETKYGKGAWTLKTLPQREGYEKYLRQTLAEVPADQNVFEIWNEAWDKMSPEDFATLCQWIVPVILESRPNAIIGPNLLGNTSVYQFDSRFIKAGGMKGMKMVALHPYAGSEDRAWLREYKQWVREQTGSDKDIYVTEFGSHSTPQGAGQALGAGAGAAGGAAGAGAVRGGCEGVHAALDGWRGEGPNVHRGLVRVLPHQPPAQAGAGGVRGRGAAGGWQPVCGRSVGWAGMRCDGV